MNTIETFHKINTFIFDIDGVLTDGKLYVGSDVEYTRTSNMKDGYAIQHAIKSGYNIIVISGAGSASYRNRLEKLGVRNIHMNISDKADCLKQLVNDNVCSLDSALYMGDDVPDLEAMNLCALSTCPENACVDVKMNIHYVSPLRGGEGCVRDVIEKVMRARGDW